MTNKIEFGAGFTAELRDYSYYITHPNGGGAMASLAEAALIRAVVAARAERDALAADLEWVAKWADIYKPRPDEYIVVVYADRSYTEFLGATLREAIAAARKQQEGAAQ